MKQSSLQKRRLPIGTSPPLHIALKCLAKNPDERYQSVPALIKDLENYIEGLPEWMEIAALQIDRKEDWLFQENVALFKHMAITRGIDLLEWVNLMISKSPFPGNIKIETNLTLKEQSKGLGVPLLSCKRDRRGLLPMALPRWGPPLPLQCRSSQPAPPAP